MRIDTDRAFTLPSPKDRTDVRISRHTRTACRSLAVSRSARSVARILARAWYLGSVLWTRLWPRASRPNRPSARVSPAADSTHGGRSLRLHEWLLPLRLHEWLLPLRLHEWLLPAKDVPCEPAGLLRRRRMCGAAGAVCFASPSEPWRPDGQPSLPLRRPAQPATCSTPTCSSSAIDAASGHRIARQLE